ncbi:DUF2357 domain-containing protein [uncultured Megasphaera sp.]|uniref:DUF2357 domain-containing protein n=1 Tax=Megasphaera massiliensis TaxID=1232428 RepID=UPI00266BA3C8|nr:DUF2357 domain-containing protein [uncultured Megasphaera sp.]
MIPIDNYEQFCKAFEGDDHDVKKEAKLLLFIQNWIIRILGYMEEDTLDYSLRKMMAQNADKISSEDTLKDALSSVVEDSAFAFRHLNESMREKIIRENVLMPVHQVKELNSYSLNWLSRQSGRTVRQKISSAGNSIMAVQRRMSLDTAENRLFVAFAKELYEQLNTKLDSLEEHDVRAIAVEEDLRDELSVFLRRDDLEEVRRWENLPPNNTLLSDRNYKKIWHGWNEMKKIDERIKNDYVFMEHRLATIFFVELLGYLREEVRIPQMPVEVDYDEYKVHLCDEKLECLAADGKTIVICKKDKGISLKFLSRNIDIEFLANKVILRIDGEKVEEYEVTQDRIYECIRRIAATLGVDTSRADRLAHKEPKKFKNVVVDLFSLHPGYMGDDSSYETLAERVLQQKYIGTDMEGDESAYYIPCDETNAIKMVQDETDTYTIPFAVDTGSMEQMKRLMHMLENYIKTDLFTYVFPDAYNELQLSMVHKAAKMVYRRIRNIPLSIGAAFYFQTTKFFKNKFKPGDFLLVVNLIDDEITYTLVAGTYDERLQDVIRDYKGIAWERHPTSTTLVKKELDSKIVDLLTKLGCAESEKIYKLLGLEGLCSEAENLSIFFGDEWFSITSEVREFIENFKLNITDSVTDFLNKNQSVVHGANIHIVSLVDNLIYKGNKAFHQFGKKEVLEGCKELERLEQVTEIPLWHDHLPALAIKLMYGKFDLIKHARVEPSFGEKQPIPINETFTLPKNCTEYHLNLVQDKSARKMQYEAVVKNPAFPLNHDVECDLKMTYQYGAEDPYDLVFVPRDSKTAGFSEAKVRWSRLERYDIATLKAPTFPTKISWDKLQQYPGLKGDFINVFEVLGNLFDLINEGYYTVDISDTFMKQGKDDEWFGWFILKKDGEDVKVRWSQRDWDKGSTPPPKISVISFWLVLKSQDRKNNGKKRYRISNLWEARTREHLWFKNKNQCIAWFDYDGERASIAIIDKNFDRPDRFHRGINNITFEVKRLPDGKLLALNIHDEDGPAPLKLYQAINICEGGNVPGIPRFFLTSYYEKWMRTLFANNRSLSERECPTAFQISFAKAMHNWVNLFYECGDSQDKMKIFTFLSLAAKDIGQEYYDAAHELLYLYRNYELGVPYEIGCAFGDLSNDMEKALMDATLKAVKGEELAIGILAKAIWHNEQFVYNADLDLLLNNYFPKAVDYIGKSLGHGNGRHKLSKYNIKSCLELILGIMRLRSLNDSNLTSKYLSLNNPKMQELYTYLEELVETNIDINSFLKLEITSKGIYENMCDLLYVLLVYVTGQDTEGEIRISINIQNEGT